MKKMKQLILLIRIIQCYSPTYVRNDYMTNVTKHVPDLLAFNNLYMCS